MAATDDLVELEARRDRAQAQFATLGDLRPGTLATNYRKCGKPNCHCAVEGDPGHGPSYVLTRSIGGKKRSVRVRAEALDETRGWMAEYRRFREVSAGFLEASEALAAARSRADRDGRRDPKRGLRKTRSRTRR